MSNRPIIEQLVEDPGQSFLYRKIERKKRPDFRSEGVWHYHPDYEITFSLKSSGKRFVGYSIEDYYPYELVLLGENLPHCWITNQSTEQYVINFKKEILESALENSPEFVGINKLLKKSKQGLKFSKATTDKAVPIIMRMNELYGFNRFINLLKLLNILSLSENIQLLTFNDYRIKDSIKASNRMQKVYTYINNNYKRENVSVSNLSDQLNMTTSSLCKFIKSITKKTFTELLVEVRLNKACKLLSETDRYISEIAYLSGFNSLSGFNRTFKKVMHVTPKEYRKIY